jgi:hypothetical protein
MSGAGLGGDVVGGGERVALGSRRREAVGLVRGESLGRVGLLWITSGFFSVGEGV